MPKLLSPEPTPAFLSREWLLVTLSSIGDAVITTDPDGRVTLLNPVAQKLTGWTQEQAVGSTLEQVFHIVNEGTKAKVENPALRALKDGVIVGLANHTLLISKDSTERPIDDSAAPILNELGEVAGAVLVFRDITERRRQEKLVKDSLDYAENILATQRDPFLVLDIKLCVKTGNDSYYKTFNTAPEETEGRSVFDLGDGQWNIPKLRELLQNVLPQNHAFEGFEVEHQFKGIGRKAMLLNARRIQKPGNHSEFILLAFEDITERKEAEAARAALSEQLAAELAATQQLQELSTRLIQVGDIGGLYEYLVAAAAQIMHSDMASLQMLDYERRALRMLADYGFAADFRQKFEWVEIGSLTSCGIALRKGSRSIMPDIETFDGVAGTPLGAAQLAVGIRASQSTPLISRDGHVLGMITTHWRRPHEPLERDLHRMDILARQAADLIERAQAKAILRESEIRYRRLFQSAKDGILILDANTGKIIDANAFMGGFVGVETQQLLGKELYEIGMFKDIEENKEAFLALQRDGYVRYENLPLQNQRGERVDVEFVANVYREDLRLVAQCNVRDISARVAMEKKIQEQSAALAEGSRRKDEFLAMLGHELRNPLAPIRSATHLLRLQEKGNENLIQRQAREIIERQVASMTRLISDLLEISRVVNGRIRIEQQIVDMNQLVRHAIETAKPLIEQHHHTLTSDLCDDPAGVWVNADATRMEEVLVNLLNNAAKYTPDGGRIEVTCSHHQNHVQITVRDNGVGIGKDLLEKGRIFDLFTQADRSLERASGGLGIGLSLAHRLVDLQGGTIEAKSGGPGKGSEFIVRLPRSTAPGHQQAAIPSTHHDEEHVGERVLVVDDNVDQVTMLATSLRLQGYSVQSAYNGPDALKLALQWKPDIVILDIGLPGLDGYEVARRLRAAETAGQGSLPLPHMQLIALTGYGQETDIALAREAGFDAHIVKPCDLPELEKLMRIPSR